MPNQTCACGAKYRFGESSIGKRAKCKTCGAVFTLQGEDAPLTLAAEPEPSPEADAESERQRLQRSAGRVHDSSAWQDVSGSKPIVDAPTPAKSYWESVLWTFLFPSSPHNVVVFAMVWVSLYLGFLAAAMLPLFGIAIFIFVSGWYAAYRFQIVASSAGGDEDLPSVEFGSDAWLDYIVGLGKWLGTWAIALTPFVIYYMLTYSSAPVPALGGPVFGTAPVSPAPVEDYNNTMDLLSSGPVEWLRAPGYEKIRLLLLVAGFFAWPMIVLCVAIGGFSSFKRPDLLAQTLINSFPGYLVTVVMMFVAILIHGVVDTGLARSSKAGLGPGVLSFLTLGLGLYADIVVVKVIGLYYHHFKHKFAWSWG